MISVLTPWRSKRETHHTSKKSVIKTVKSVLKRKGEQKMKIELFYREPKSGSEYRGKESLIEFETRVNNFMTDKQVIDIKIQGNDENPFIMVIYNEAN